MSKRPSVRGRVNKTARRPVVTPPAAPVTTQPPKVTTQPPGVTTPPSRPLSSAQTLAYYLDTGQITELLHNVVDTIRKRAFSADELLPDLDNFLRQILAKEKLSPFAEKRRKYYVERLDVIKFNPPSLPPRPEGGLMKFPVGDGSPQHSSPQPTPKTTTTIAKTSPVPTTTTKGSPRLAANAVISSPKLIKTSHASLRNGHSANSTALNVGAKNSALTNGQHDDFIEENIYADMDDSDTPKPEDLYLVPEDAQKSGSLPYHAKTASLGSHTQNSGSLGSKSQRSWSDSDSGTSYESYGEDEDSSTYMNINQSEGRGGAKDDVPLPKVAKKKKKVRQGEELPIATLPNVTFRGELYHKGSWSWKRRYCVVSDNRMIVYKSEKDPRPILKFVLLGYDVVYLERDGRRNHVIRVSHQGCDSHFFSTDLKEIADLWICHLSAGMSTTEAPSSGDSVNVSNDATKTTSSSPSIQHSTSTSNLSSSEGGSGDGVVATVAKETPVTVIKTVQRTPSEDKKASGSDKKKKNILSDILGTFSKKKGQKIRKNVIVGDLPTDPAANISGIVEVCHDARTSGEWCQKFCLIKARELHCYHDNLADGAEFVLSLAGAELENAGKDTKRPLSVRVQLGDKETIMLDWSDLIEQGKWLHALIVAKEGLAFDSDVSQDVNALVYENQEVATAMTSQDAAGDTEDDIYDEVDADKMLDSRASGKPVMRSSSLSSPAPSRPVLRTSSGASSHSAGSGPSDWSTGKPPPLPSTEPPKRPLMSKKRRSQEAGEMYANYDEKESSNLSTEMASAFSQIKSQMETGGSQRSTGKATSTSTARTTAAPKRTTTAKTTATAKTATLTNAQSEDGVVKCHIGPTIAEDQDLLKKTQNPILTTLRDERRKGSLDADTIQTQIDDIKRKILTMKKQKSDLRGRVLTSRGGRDKQVLETQLSALDTLIEESEQTVTKLHLLAQEKGGSLSRNGSFQSQSSGGSSRNNSFRTTAGSDISRQSSDASRNNSPKVTDRPTALAPTLKARTAAVTTTTSTKSTRSTAPVTKTSPRGSKADTRPTAGRGVTSPGSQGRGVTKTTSPTAPKTTVAKTTTQAPAKTGQGRGTMATTTSQKKVTTVTSTQGSVKTESPRVGQTRIRTITTTTTSRSVAGQRAATTTTKDSAPATNNSTVRGVKERLKLWESRQEDSTC